MSQYFSAPATIPLSQILPVEPLLLMGAGPVPIPTAVAQANSVVINHLGETMDTVIGAVKKMGQYAFQTKSEKIIGISGPASAAMEMAVGSALGPGKSVLVLKYGTFSARFEEMAKGVGADIDVLEAGPGEPIFPEQLVKKLNERKYDVVTMAQGETSSGVCLHQIEDLAKIAKDNGALVLLDAVCTLSTMPMNMDAWGVDIAITGGQKGLSSIPGVSLIAFSKEAWKVVGRDDRISPHWCLDPRRAWKFWGHQEYHYTAPVPGILALHEALRIICEETLEKRFKRHQICSKALQLGIETMGLELFVPETWRLNSVIAIKIPKEINGARVRKFMVENYHVEIAGAFGLPIVRVGQMGEQCRTYNLFRVLHAMGMAFQNEGAQLDLSSGMAALDKGLAADKKFIIG